MSASDGPARLLRWRRLDERWGLGRERRPSEILSRYRAEDTARTELADLVAAERECCGFVTWTLTQSAEELLLAIRGSEADLDSLGVG